MSYPMRVTIEDGTHERLARMMKREKRKESNAVDVLLTEALDARDAAQARREKVRADAAD